MRNPRKSPKLQQKTIQQDQINDNQILKGDFVELDINKTYSSNVSKSLKQSF